MRLEIKDLRVHYGKIEAIKGISVVVNEGEIVTLIGANGAGKTTTLKTISGLRPVSSGSIVFDGKIFLNCRRTNASSLESLRPPKVEEFSLV